MRHNKVPIFILGLLLLSGMVLSCQKESLSEASCNELSGRLVFNVESDGDRVLLRKDAVVGLFLSDVAGDALLRVNEVMPIGENGETMPERDTVVGASDGLVHAYCPYDASWDDALESVKEFSVKTDQTASLDYIGSDLMWAAGVKTARPTTEVTLSHAMSRILIHMTSHSPENDMGNVGVTLQGMKTGCHVFLPEHSLQVDTATVSDIRCHMADIKEHRVSLSAVIPPQDIPDGRIRLNITLGGETYDYDIPSVSFESGKLYVYALSFADDNFVFGNGSVSDWTDDADEVLDILTGL